MNATTIEDSDREQCLRVFDSNTPRYFAPEERETFAAFLDALPGPFWVIKDQESRTVLACGGVTVTDDGHTAWLRWGMVDGATHRQGIGTHLLRTRLDWIHNQPTIDRVCVATTEPALGFFKRMGFSVISTKPHHFGSGMTRYDLERSIEDVPHIPKALKGDSSGA